MFCTCFQSVSTPVCLRSIGEQLNFFDRGGLELRWPFFVGKNEGHVTTAFTEKKCMSNGLSATAQPCVVDQKRF